MKSTGSESYSTPVLNESKSLNLGKDDTDYFLKVERGGENVVQNDDCEFVKSSHSSEHSSSRRPSVSTATWKPGSSELRVKMK